LIASRVLRLLYPLPLSAKQTVLSIIAGELDEEREAQYQERKLTGVGMSVGSIASSS
jgi:hypothetical protein